MGKPDGSRAANRSATGADVFANGNPKSVRTSANTGGARTEIAPEAASIATIIGG